MSAGVSDQRMKGQGNQVTNVGKDQQHLETNAAVSASGEELAEASWRHQQQQPATQPSYAPPISSADPYASAPGYYGTGTPGFPYQAFGVGDGTWSTNGTDPMTFLGGYTPHDTYGMDGVFSPTSTAFSTAAFGQPASATFNYFHGNGDYSAWGQISRAKQYDDYYRTEGLYVPDGLKAVEQGVQALGLGEPKMDKDRSLQDSKESSGGLQPKKTTWASIASQPAKPAPPMQSSGLKKKGPGMPPPPIIPGKHNMDIGTWDGGKSGSSTPPQPAVPVRVQPPAPRAPPPQGPPAPIPTAPAPGPPPMVARTPWSSAGNAGAPPQRAQAPPMQPPTHHQPLHPPPLHHAAPPQMAPHSVPMAALAPMAPMQNQSNPILEELRVKNDYNPTEFDLSAPAARFFVIKSYSEDDIHRSIKYEIWCSTDHGNKRLDSAYREREHEGGIVYLFFSVNGSGHFCGMAQMVSAVDYNSNSSVWSQDKWKGQFKVRWIYVKDVPNGQLRHIKLENNENKAVTNSRDTQEVPHAHGLQVLRILHGYCHSTSIFDDFVHYEKRQEEEDSRKVPEQHQNFHRDNHHQGGYEKPHSGYGKHDNYSGGRGGFRDHGGYNRDHGRDGSYKEHNDGPTGGGASYKGAHPRDRHPPEHHSYRDRDRDSGYRPHQNAQYKERGDNAPRGRGRGRN